MGENSIISFFLPEWQKKTCPKAEALGLEVGPRSGLYLLVTLIDQTLLGVNSLFKLFLCTLGS